MPNPPLPTNSLLVYRSKPARLLESGEKIKIEVLEDAASLRTSILSVRPKDVIILHPGPIKSFAELQPPAGDVQTAWEIIGNIPVSLGELAELAYGENTPASLWAAWTLLTDGLYFQGAPDAVQACPAEEVERRLAARKVRAAEKQAWSSFLARLASHTLLPEDRKYLRETEELALGKRAASRLLDELRRPNQPESAHTLLLENRIWDERTNPYPERFHISQELPELALPNLPDEPRLDLTHLRAFAIDDEGNQEPDDAISLDGDRLWIHVADVAAIVASGSPLDEQAVNRGATLYLPEGNIPMLPPGLTTILGLGLQSVSPALSFGIRLDDNAHLSDIEITPTWVKVKRLSYEQAEGLLEGEPFHSLFAYVLRSLIRRTQDGAISLDFPESIVKVVNGEVIVRPLHPLKSRLMVREAMVLAGEAAARFAIDQHIPVPFASQESASTDASEDQERRLSPSQAAASLPDLPGVLSNDAFIEYWQRQNLARQQMLRRQQKRGVNSLTPSPHQGLGVSCYARATSPLRRYIDLLTHQQLRSWLAACSNSPSNYPPLRTEQQIVEQMGISDAAVHAVNQAESLSLRHWILVYLLQHPSWRGKGIVIEKNENRGKVIIPELALETNCYLPQDISLNALVSLTLRKVDLPALDAHFEITSR